jgi:hypothetical protein
VVPQPYYPEVQQPQYQQPLPVAPVQPTQMPQGYPQQAPGPMPVQPPAPQTPQAYRPPVAAGWGSAQQVMDSTSSFANKFSPGTSPSVILFLDPEPFASYSRHWVDRVIERKAVKRAYTCLAHRGQNCPLCEIADRPQAVSSFNVLLLNEDGSVVVKLWEVGAKIFNRLRDWSMDPKTGPITKSWYAVTKAQGEAATLWPIEPTTIVSQYGMILPTPEAVSAAAAQRYDASVIEYASVSDLQQVAMELSSAG